MPLLLLLLVCSAVALGIYFMILRPFLLPLTSRIPNGRQYRAGVYLKRQPR